MALMFQKRGWEFPMALVHMQFATEEEEEFMDKYEEMKQGADDPGKDYGSTETARRDTRRTHQEAKGISTLLDLQD
uniref:Uncharacterized protein n=1 Tax=Moniliophthora roreri TaxID=221103 RepID=A0A0W0FDN6_MONRR